MSSLISIIVPVYKVEKVLPRCIDSILVQEFENWELILIDDGSPDKSGEICDEYAKKDSRICVIHQKNQGVSAARNQGIRTARGEYICFVDSDDYVSDQYLSSFDSSSSPDFVLQGMTFVYGGRRNDETFIPDHNTSTTVYGMLNNPSVHVLIQGPYCKLYRKAIIDENGLEFPLNISYSEDGIFLLNYLCHCQFVQLVSACYYYYTHETESSLTTRFHKGEELYDAVLGQYYSFHHLDRIHDLQSNSFWYAYRNHLAIDYYQSVYNTWIDHDISWVSKFCFLFKSSKDFLRFIVPDRNLPRGFRFVRIVIRLLRSV